MAGPSAVPMTPERWRQVKAILSAAMDRPAGERAQYLADACDADAALRREVDSLLEDALREEQVAAHDSDQFARELIATAASAAARASRGSETLFDDLQQVLGVDYRLDQELGGGGMSRVFLGVEIPLNRAVVVKVLNPEQAHGASAERFAREVRFAARLQQANIVPVLRVGEVRELAFYIMPYHGNTLRERIASVAPPTAQEALDVLKNIAKALACAHSEGVVHRDIKPENILLSGGTAVVADFGIAKTISELREPSTPNASSTLTSTTAMTIALDLGVETLLEGTVRRSGDRVRIGVRLLNAADGLHLWSEQYDRKLEDIFAVQEELAQAITAALEDKLVPARRLASAITPASRSRHKIVNSDAFELYLTGRSLLEQRADGVLQGLQCLEKASKLAPDFSGAHAAISMAYTLFGIYNILRPRDAFPKARSAAERALAIDADDVLAIVMRAHTALWHEWDFQTAESLVRRALALAPSFYLAHECLGYVLAAQGRFDESIDAMERGRSLDPISENATYDLAWILLLSGRWEQAIRELEPALGKYPRMSELRRVYGFCLFYAGRVSEACVEFRRVLELKVGDRWGGLNLVQALAALGEVDEARRLVMELEDRAAREPIPPLGIAIMHHWLGNDEAALTRLEESIEARDYWLVMARFDPSLIRLRDHSRFVQAMRRVQPV